jgi:hypothetical protein
VKVKVQMSDRRARTSSSRSTPELQKEVGKVGRFDGWTGQQRHGGQVHWNKKDRQKSDVRWTDGKRATAVLEQGSANCEYAIMRTTGIVGRKMLVLQGRDASGGCRAGIGRLGIDEGSPTGSLLGVLIDPPRAWLRAATAAKIGWLGPETSRVREQTGLKSPIVALKQPTLIGLRLHLAGVNWCVSIV